VLIRFLADLSVSWFQSPCEKVGESGVLGVGSCSFVNFNIIQITKKTKKGRSKTNWHIHLANIAGYSTLNSSVTDDEFESLVLFEKFVEVDKVKDSAYKVNQR